MATPSPTSKKAQPIPWSHEETVHLVQAYQEKWFSLKRGPLKSGQWEEVAVTVAARCGYDYSHPSKTSTQCRHKIEKLRKRYRSERHRLSSAWPFFNLLESLDLGPLPISQIPFHHHHDEAFSKSQSINYILQRPTIVNRFAPERKFNAPREAIGENESSFLSKLAAEISAFSERFVGMENMKMELIKETERSRMEMENKRTDMILQSQQKIANTISRAFGSRMSDDQGR